MSEDVQTNGWDKVARVAPVGAFTTGGVRARRAQAQAHPQTAHTKEVTAVPAVQSETETSAQSKTVTESEGRNRMNTLDLEPQALGLHQGVSALLQRRLELDAYNTGGVF